MSVTLHTDLGDIKVEVHCEECPVSAENFLGHCAKGSYNGTRIHRCIKTFMVQMGDPTGTGKGGESIWGGCIKDEIRPGLKHDRRGVVSFASNKPDTNGSQFFITFDRHAHLDGKYTVFGKVIDGWATLDKLEAVEVDRKNRPVEQILINSVTIHANPIAEG